VRGPVWTRAATGRGAPGHYGIAVPRI
jgi:hypothetical protein